MTTKNGNGGRSHRPHTWVALALMVTAACGERAPDPTNATVTDSAGVRIVYNHEPAWDASEAWTVAPEPTLVLDGAEPADGFGQVVAARRLSNGTVAVVDALHGGALLYAADGTFLGRAGAPGRGAGRFEFPVRAFVLPGDTLGLEDYPTGHVSYFSPTGELLRFAELDRQATFGGILRDHVIDETWALPNGGRVMLVRSPAGGSAPTGQAHRPVMGYLRVAPGGTPVDTLGWLPTTREAYVELDGRRRSVTSLLSPQAALAAGGDRLVLAESDAWDLRVFEDGELVQRVRMTGARRPVTAEERDSIQAQEVAAMEAGRVPADRIAEWQRLWEAAPRDEYWPTFGSLRVDPAGRVWASGGGLPGEDGPAWRVFDRWGTYLGVVRMPPELDVLDIGEDYVLGTVRDPAGYTSVQIHPLIRP